MSSPASLLCRVATAASLALGFVALPETARADAEDAPIVYRIHLNQDRSRTTVASRAIEFGLKAALIDLDVEGIIPGKRVAFDFVINDHRTNIYRAKLNYEKFLQDDRALVSFADVHSPPLIRYKKWLNANGVLTLVPWAAGAPVTRSDGSENWIFRLSVDDRSASYVFAEYAFGQRACRDLHFLLIDNPWGRANAQALIQAMQDSHRRPASISWIPWNMEADVARRMVNMVRYTREDCILIVASGEASARIIDALGELPKRQRPTVLSHWGVATSDFAARVPLRAREAVNLKFIQSCHDLFAQDAKTALAFQRLRRVAGEAEWTNPAMPAAPGFVHAYDLGLLLGAALRQAKLTGEVAHDRRALRDALEALEEPVEGLLKTYQRPFTPAVQGAYAHEALLSQNLCMARFDENNAIRVEPRG